MNTNFRALAQQHLKDAREDLTIDAPVKLRSAALSLRMAMEALTYERAKLYKDELPISQYETWQPRKLMKLLLEIDPYADKSGSISYGIEPAIGKTPDTMHFLGTENVLNLATIKANYDALGSYLHVPTLKQLSGGQSPDIGKLRAKCEAVAGAVEKAVNSSVWNVNFKNLSSIECYECKQTITRRFRPGQGSRDVECTSCGAEFRLMETDEGKVQWEPKQSPISCPTKDCDHSFYILSKDIKRGSCWTCPKCNQSYRIDLAIVPNEHRPPNDELV